MNTKHFLHHGSEPAIARSDRHTTGFHERFAIARKALERWENEGGKIPGISKVMNLKSKPTDRETRTAAARQREQNDRGAAWHGAPEP